ncbi:MAG TPA: ABC transporter permease [Kofleriaceae bacterium]|jgi:putative ABC transport system permease protein|nr:ABC transporter permease [Kofleriaceae bacterium]
MLAYYLDLARRSFKRNLSLTALMVIAIAFGVGASMTTLTVLHVLSVDPIPGKSQQLFYVQLDPVRALGYMPGEEPMEQMTRLDSEALLRMAKADRQAMMTSGQAAVEPQRTGLAPFFVDGRWTSADFFSMFQVPWLAGAGWNAEDDTRAARVAVITRALADKLYGTTEAVGRTIRVQGADLRVIGVAENWRPAPHFYDLNTDVYGAGEQLFVPFTTSRDLKLARSGSLDCWDDPPGDPLASGAPCVWTQFWVELSTADRAAAYHDFLVSYSLEQMRTGRYQRPPNVRLRNVTEWLDFKGVVPSDIRLQTWIAFGFLLVCLINTVGLLLTKFLRRSSEIGVRRALGASKRSIFVQLLIEAGSIGLVGGTLGLGLAWLGLLAVRHQPADYADLARLDLPMLVSTFTLAILASLLAGLLPAWRGCQITPAIQLKSQ